MNDEKKVSVVLFFYNEEEHLSKAIDSVLSQTYSNIELVLVNDGSTDRCDEIVKHYSDKRIMYISYSENKHQAYAANRGAEVATGDFICFFAGDDIMVPERIETQVKYLNDHEDISVVGCGYTCIDKNGIETGVKYLYPYHSSDEISAAMLFCNSMGGGCALLRRKIVVDNNLLHDEKCKVSADYLFWINMLKYAKMANIDKYLILYRNSTDYVSQSSKVSSLDRNSYDIMMINIITKAWCQKGFQLNMSDYQFIYKHMFKKERIIWIGTLLQCNKTYKKIKSQIDALVLSENEKKLILNYYDIQKQICLGRS